MKLYKQLLILISLIILLLTIVTSIVYLIVEGPASLLSLFSSKNEVMIDKSTLSKKDTFNNSREQKNGIDYIKINTFELYELCDSKGHEFTGKPFVMRGIVYKPEHLISMGEFGLMRISMWCCAADSTAFGFRIPYDNLNSLKKGSWVKVYGHLEKQSGNKSKNSDSKSNFAKYDEIHKKWYFKADYIETTDKPEKPFITYWSSKEPFYY